MRSLILAAAMAVVMGAAPAEAAIYHFTASGTVSYNADFVGQTFTFQVIYDTDRGGPPSSSFPADAPSGIEGGYPWGSPDVTSPITYFLFERTGGFSYSGVPTASRVVQQPSTPDSITQIGGFLDPSIS